MKRNKKLVKLNTREKNHLRASFCHRVSENVIMIKNGHIKIYYKIIENIPGTSGVKSALGRVI